MTLAILPLSTLAGAIRNLRAHFGDQVFLLHNRTRWMIAVAAIDATVTVVSASLAMRYWGLAGAAGATVAGRLAAATVSFTIGFSKFGLTLPIGHLIRIALATDRNGRPAQAISRKRRPSIVLVAHIAAGAASYTLQRLPFSTRRHCSGCSARVRNTRKPERPAPTSRSFSRSQTHAPWQTRAAFFCIDESNGRGRGSLWRADPSSSRHLYRMNNYRPVPRQSRP